MAKGLFTFLKTFFGKAPQGIEHVATTLTSQGTVVKKTLNATTELKSVQHIYQQGSHMAELGVKSTTLRRTKNCNNMVMHGNKPYYDFNSLTVKCNDGRWLTFYTQKEARDFFATANKYNSYMRV